MTTTTNNTHLMTLTHPDWDGIERRIYESGRGSLSYSDYLPQGGHCGRVTIPGSWDEMITMVDGLLGEGATQTHPA